MALKILKKKEMGVTADVIKQGQTARLHGNTRQPVRSASDAAVGSMQGGPNATQLRLLLCVSDVCCCDCALIRGNCSGQHAEQPHETLGFALE